MISESSHSLCSFVRRANLASSYDGVASPSNVGAIHEGHYLAGYGACWAAEGHSAPFQGI